MSGDILDRITGAVRARLDAEPAPEHLERRARACAEGGGRRSLRAAVMKPGVRVIAECKQRSPSAGVLRPGLDPVGLARAYEEGGAAAISVVTERDFFRGDPTWLAAVRAHVSLPVLRKDFLVSPRQVFESVLLGADAVLLIARLLAAGDQLPAMIALADQLGLEVLLEVHDGEELERALTTPAVLIGVNARNLKTFEIDTAGAAELLRRVPSDRLAVAESGISGPAAVRALFGSGVRCFLVGEHLLRADGPRSAIEELVSCV